MDDNEKLLSKKNTLAFQQNMEHLRKMAYEQQVQIDTMKNAINSLSEKLTSLEQMLQIQKVMFTSRGPSVKD